MANPDTTPRELQGWRRPEPCAHVTTPPKNPGKPVLQIGCLTVFAPDTWEATSCGDALRLVLSEIATELYDTALQLDDLHAVFEKSYLESALTQTNGAVIEAAKLLGVSRRTLQRKLRHYGIDKRRFKRDN